MHQPNYHEPGSNRLAMPWVRFHALKDYLDMPLLAARYEKVKVTFNLVPSLLDQIDHYVDGGTDRHLELSRVNPESMTGEQKRELIATFFEAHLANMIEPYPRYISLYRKANEFGSIDGQTERLFSSAELRDLQVWSNLVWVDPMFRNEEPVARLFQKGRDYSEEEKITLLEWQVQFMGRIVPTYRGLLEEGKIEISFTPYYHPILPLLCDTDSALEALPDLTLPSLRFRFPEDADRQIAMSLEKYQQLFGRKMRGMWPSEGSISEEVLNLAAARGIEWVAGDEDLLWHSVVKSGLSTEENHPHALYQFKNGPRIFFRDHNLSDKIGFVYSNWPAEKAAQDFVARIKEIRLARLGDLDRTVLPIILDGENVWEYFPDDGHEFLSSLYERLAGDEEIELVTMSEAAQAVPPRDLPRIMAGSWINHNFRIWIGHSEDNAAWDLLTKTREALVTFERDHSGFDKAKLSDAWRQIYIAEGSDWCWWYGDEHRGNHNAEFDHLFRQHLMAVYNLLGLEIPGVLEKPIHLGSSSQKLHPPDGLLTPIIDGRQTHFYEWAGAGRLDSVAVGGSMHRVDQTLAGLYYGFDHQRLYIRLDFISKNHIDLLQEPRLRLELATEVDELMVIELSDLSEGSRGGDADKYAYAVGEIVEIAIERSCIWKRKYGSVDIRLSLLDGTELVERWARGVPLKVELPEQNKELFWLA